MVASWAGFCPICGKNTRFTASGTWSRESLICETCDGGSVPRERALALALRQIFPEWQRCAIHESSPAPRGLSRLMAAMAPDYLASQFFPDVALGTMVGSVRCENLEAQTFPSESFDLVISQDVMERVFDPEAAYREVYRTLRPGGYYLHTTPIYRHLAKSVRKAQMDPDGSVAHLAEPEYRGNPISGEGSLVTFHYGNDLVELIANWAPFDVEVRRYFDRTHGIVAEFTEILVCQRPGVIRAPSYDDAMGHKSDR